MTKPAKLKRSHNLADAAESARFIAAAKKAEADERPEEFEKVLKRVARKAVKTNP